MTNIPPSFYDIDMRILDFTADHVGEAAALARADYARERGRVTALPEAPVFPDLMEFAGNGLGVAAFDEGGMLGFLCSGPPWEHAFGTPARGAYSPLHAHGVSAGAKDRGAVFGRLYQAAAERWVGGGMTYHSVTLYAHDVEAVEAFFRNGFGMRCVDAMRPMEPIGGECAEAHCQELDKAGMEAVEPLMRGLAEHQGRSPCFMRSTEEEFQAWFLRARERESRVFVAMGDGGVVAYVEMKRGGENFAADAAGTMNLCGAYCLPEHRGAGVARSLIDHAIGTLRGEGYVRLGVDYESFNPTASAFWGKHFEAYTVSVVRRIDCIEVSM